MAIRTTRVTAGIVLINRSGEILLQLRDDRPDIPDPGCWVVPGGGIDPGETAEDGARRELLEETGYRIGEPRHVLTRQLERDGALETQHYFWDCYDERQPVRCFEGQELRFVPATQVSSLRTSPDLAWIIELALREHEAITAQREAGRTT